MTIPFFPMEADTLQDLLDIFMNIILINVSLVCPVYTLCILSTALLNLNTSFNIFLIILKNLIILIFS